jgi:hypothetical protein
MNGLQDECELILRAQHMRASCLDNIRLELLRRQFQCGVHV